MDGLRSELEAAWAEFQRTESLRLVPETLEAEWTRGRDTYLAFLIPIRSPVVVSHLRRFVRAVDNIPGIEPYPPDYWHITIKGIGFESEDMVRPDDITKSIVRSVADAAAVVFANESSFKARIGLAAAFPEVVFAEVWEAVQVRELNNRLLESVPNLVRYPFDGPVFLPHVSIARFTSNEALVQLKQTVAKLRQEGPGPPFLVDEVRLVRAHLSEGAPTLETIETYRLK